MLDELIKKYEDKEKRYRNKMERNDIDIIEVGKANCYVEILQDLEKLKENTEFWEKCWFDKCERLQQERNELKEENESLKITIETDKEIHKCYLNEHEKAWKSQQKLDDIREFVQKNSLYNFSTKEYGNLFCTGKDILSIIDKE